MTGDHALLYDSDCGFCTWCLHVILRWDRKGRLRPVAIQSAEGDLLLTGMSAQERLGSWHLVQPDGAVVSAGAAAAPLARLLPGGRPLAALFERFPRATERAYRWVAAHRGAFGKVFSR
jgi:predicted DCC family thiol-disulfide oxidoreductase YuxK